ncbi:MAG: complex I NDUFA9 subunit family protein [Deltaproteobacteria bacterium]|nr:complex I NDUFA9 subunit family protein [Deltaproteobacteria bacterium]MBW1987356.1 complex I NDUFA9 subunit family protein [Deltaproteobacteria bacterium]MBW2135198.1 complex I NDUFA9 subunit family protein [Deltaproteobacteria bacterium]
MLVLVTGGSGFVGNQVVAELLARGHRVRCLLRRGSEKKLKALNQVEVAPGDVTHPDTLPPAVKDCDAVIHLVGIIREFPGRGVTFEKLHQDATQHVVEAAQAAGVQRYLHMSALGARPAPADPYHVTNYRADEYVQGSGLTYTIFRPSVIYGPEDQSINLFVRQIKTHRIVPIIGDGRYQMQPVPVWTMAQAFALALEKPATENRIYDVGGPEPLTFNEVINTLGQVLHRWVFKVHLPVGMMHWLAGYLGRFAWFPLTPGQIRMLLEGSTCDPTAFYQDFGLEPISFKEGLDRYLS